MIEQQEYLSDLIRRLRGEYRVPITDGLGATGGGEEPDNPNEFVRKFETPPISKEAAQVIEFLIDNVTATNKIILELIDNCVRVTEPVSAGIDEVESTSDKISLSVEEAEEIRDVRDYLIYVRDNVISVHRDAKNEEAGEDSLDEKARRLYNESVSNDSTIHSNRFPSWSELTESQRDDWRANVKRDS